MKDLELWADVAVMKAELKKEIMMLRADLQKDQAFARDQFAGIHNCIHNLQGAERFGPWITAARDPKVAEQIRKLASKPGKIEFAPDPPKYCCSDMLIAVHMRAIKVLPKSCVRYQVVNNSPRETWSGACPFCHKEIGK